MHKFLVKAPGKVILHGEHAVVYQKPAIAAAIGLSTKLKFQAQSNTNVAIFQLETLNCTLEIQIAEFNVFLKNIRLKYPDESMECTAKLLEEVRQEVAKRMENAIVITSAKQQHIQKAYTAIHFLLAGALLSSPKSDMKLETGFLINIDSEFNVGAGLGSSASFGVVLATTFLLLAQHFTPETMLQEAHKALISQWAFVSERIMHGTPSGVDNTVCTYGGMLRFVKGQGFQEVKVQRPLNILLVDSRVNRSTADIVANVRHLAETFPTLINSLWTAMEKVVDAAIPLYESFGNSKDDSEKFEKLERLFQINNDLLKAIGVSHPKLERFYHPGKKEKAYFLTSKDEQILEVLEFDEPRRSWFIASEICSNGKLYITTTFDTLLFALHYVRKHCATKALSWDCLCADLDASCARFLSNFVHKSELPLIADEKAIDDVCYYKYNATRSLAWLAIKARTLAAALIKQQIHCGQFAQSAHFNPVADEVEQLDREKNALVMACDIVGSYLDLELSQQLLKYFNLSESATKEIVENKQKRKSKNQINDADSKKAKVDNDHMAITCVAIKPVTPAKTLTTKEKQLAKGAKGSKSISSFFAKKS